MTFVSPRQPDSLSFHTSHQQAGKSKKTDCAIVIKGWYPPRLCNRDLYQHEGSHLISMPE